MSVIWRCVRGSRVRVVGDEMMGEGGVVEVDMSECSTDLARSPCLVLARRLRLTNTVHKLLLTA